MECNKKTKQRIKQIDRIFQRKNIGGFGRQYLTYKESLLCDERKQLIERLAENE